MGYCDWVFANDADRNYHDNEWGIPVHDDDHASDCPCFQKINAEYPVIRLKPDHETAMQES